MHVPTLVLTRSSDKTPVVINWNNVNTVVVAGSKNSYIFSTGNNECIHVEESVEEIINMVRDRIIVRRSSLQKEE